MLINRTNVLSSIMIFLFFNLLLGLFSGFVFAQTELCSLSDNNPDCYDGSNKPLKTVYLDIKILVKEGEDPALLPAIDENEVMSDVNRANTIWQYAGIKFKENISSIYEEGFWNILPSGEPELDNLLADLFDKYRDNNSINIYYVNEIRPQSPYDIPTPAGLTIDPCLSIEKGILTGIVMSGDAEDTDGYVKKSNTLAHELGHMLLCSYEHKCYYSYNLINNEECYYSCNLMRPSKEPDPPDPEKTRPPYVDATCLTDDQICRARTYENLQDVAGTSSIWGVILDENNQLIENATISLYDSKGYLKQGQGNFVKPILSDEFGFFDLYDFNAGDYYLKISKNGYHDLRYPPEGNICSKFFYTPPFTGKNLGDIKLQSCYDPTPISIQVNQPAIEGFVCQSYYQRYKFDLNKNGNAYIITVTPYDSGNLFLYYSDTINRLDDPSDFPHWTDCSNAYECSSARHFQAGEKKVITFFTPDTGGDPNSAFIAVYGITDVDYKVEAISIPVISLEMNLPAGWSMISLPVKPQNCTVSALFPKAEVVYSYEKDAGYVRIPNNQDLEVGKGYWILSFEDQNSVLTGQQIPSYADTVSEDGWSMIGGCSSNAKVSTNGCKIGVIYKYALGSGYQRVPTSEALEPCHGYWILFQDVVGQCQFAVDQNNPPSAPILSTPANEAPNIDPTNITFIWQPSSDPDGDNVEYCLIVKKEGDPNDITVYAGCDDEIFITETSFTLPIQLENNSQYFWAVWAKDEHGTWSEASEWWSFNTSPEFPEEQWQDIVDDNRLTSAIGQSLDPSLGVDSAGNIHIVWVDERNGKCEIYYTKRDNNGNPLVNDTPLTSAIYKSINPSLGVDSAGNIHIAWKGYQYSNYEIYDYGIYYTKLNNNGNPLVNNTLLNSTISDNPSLGVDNAGNIHIVYSGYSAGKYGIYYTKLNNNGNPLVNNIPLTSNSTSTLLRPSLGIDNAGNIHIAWEDYCAGNYEIYYTKLDNNGNTLVNDTPLTSNNAESITPSLGVDSAGNIHITWKDRRNGNPEIYYTKLDNNGNTLVDDTKLTTYNSTHSGNPTLGVDSAGNIHIAWVDNRDGDDYNGEGNYEIYYTKLDNNGNTLVDNRLTFDSASSDDPSLGVDSAGNIHIAWVDNRDGNYEIYYTKGKTIPK